MHRCDSPDLIHQQAIRFPKQYFDNSTKAEFVVVAGEAIMESL